MDAVDGRSSAADAISVANFSSSVNDNTLLRPHIRLTASHYSSIPTCDLLTHCLERNVSATSSTSREALIANLSKADQWTPLISQHDFRCCPLSILMLHCRLRELPAEGQAEELANTVVQFEKDAFVAYMLEVLRARETQVSELEEKMRSMEERLAGRLDLTDGEASRLEIVRDRPIQQEITPEKKQEQIPTSDDPTFTSDRSHQRGSIKDDNDYHRLALLAQAWESAARDLARRL